MSTFERTVATRCRRALGGGGGGNEEEESSDDDSSSSDEAKEALLSGWRRALRAPRPPPSDAFLGEAWPPRAPPDVLDAIPDADLRAAARSLWTARPPLALACAELAAAFCGQRCDGRRCLRAFEHMRAALVALRAAGFGGGDCGGGARQLRVYIVWVDRPKRRPLLSSGVSGSSSSSSNDDHPPPLLPDASSSQRGPAQANGGLSFGCARPEILVYRHEEWWKVFLHEAIHALGADFSARNRRAAGGEEEAAEREALAAALFPGARLADTQHLLLTEAFTEAWARLWHLAWTAVRRAPDSRRRQRRVFDRLLAESRIFAAAQAMRWLAPDHTAMLGSASPQPDHHSLPPFQEDTAGLMYFVLAAALLCHPPALLGGRPPLQKHIIRCTSADPNSECARVAVAAMQSNAFARSRRQATELLPTTETSTRMTHLDAAPDDDGGDDTSGRSKRRSGVGGGGGGKTKRRKRRHHRRRGQF